MPSLITLTTDFEEQDHFAAALKGVLYSLCPGVQVVDLSHTIPRSSVRAAAVFIAGAVPHFPKGTVHVVNIAPGPQAIAVFLNGQYVVCPNNGVITLLSERFPVEEARTITNPEILMVNGEQRFIGREVFAPAAAALANGAPLAKLGERVDDLAVLDLGRPKRDGDRVVHGRIIHVDRYGNLVSNIHRSFLDGRRVTNVVVGDFPVGAVAESYTKMAPGSPSAVYGSAGYLEIAFFGERAEKRLNMGVGVLVRAELAPK